MKGTGWTLIIAAVILHFTIIEWHAATSGRGHIFAFLFARSSTKLVGEHGKEVRTFNKQLSGVLGLVVPAAMIAGGFVLINRAFDNEEQAKKMVARITRPEPEPDCDSDSEDHPKLIPCPDCGRNALLP